jgi:hypothetical protein
MSIVQSYEPTASAAAQSERENNHVRAGPAQTTNIVENQAGNSRGGGVGGGSVRSGADELRSPGRKKWFGGQITKTADSSEYSSFFNSSCASDFFSDCRCFAICRHKGQGCRPSKVWVMASERHSVRALLASIVAHATDCSIAQWPPVAHNSDKINSPWPKRLNTACFLAEEGPEVKWSGHTG